MNDEAEGCRGHATAETQAEGIPYHILAATSIADERTRVLKPGDASAVFDHYGDIKPGGAGSTVIRSQSVYRNPSLS